MFLATQVSKLKHYSHSCFPPPQTILKKKICVRINQCAREILGESFLNSEEHDKIKMLDHLVWSNSYIPRNLLEGKTEEAEKNYQVLLASGQIPPILEGAIPGLFSTDLDSTSIFWSSEKHHTVRAPYIKGTTQSKHRDKDLSLEMLHNLIENKKFYLADKLTLIVEGCDNNEAAAKFFTYLIASFKKEVNMVCTDVNFNALARCRGLDVFIQQQLFRHIGRNLTHSDIIVRDSFNDKDVLTFKHNIRQRIAMPFRLTAISPVEKLPKYINRLIRENDLCLMHFFQDNQITSKTLTDKYKYSERSHANTNDLGTDITYCYGNGLKISIWRQDTLLAFIKKVGGEVLDMQEITTESDSGNEVSLWLCVVQKKCF